MSAMTCFRFSAVSLSFMVELPVFGVGAGVFSDRLRFPLVVVEFAFVSAVDVVGEGSELG